MLGQNLKKLISYLTLFSYLNLTFSPVYAGIFEEDPKKLLSSGNLTLKVERQVNNPLLKLILTHDTDTRQEKGHVFFSSGQMDFQKGLKSLAQNQGVIWDLKEYGSLSVGVDSGLFFIGGTKSLENHFEIISDLPVAIKDLSAKAFSVESQNVSMQGSNNIKSLKLLTHRHKNQTSVETGSSLTVQNLIVNGILQQEGGITFEDQAQLKIGKDAHFLNKGSMIGQSLTFKGMGNFSTHSNSKTTFSGGVKFSHFKGTFLNVGSTLFGTLEGELSSLKNDGALQSLHPMNLTLTSTFENKNRFIGKGLLKVLGDVINRGVLGEEDFKLYFSGECDNRGTLTFTKIKGRKLTNKGSLKGNSSHSSITTFKLKAFENMEDGEFNAEKVLFTTKMDEFLNTGNIKTKELGFNELVDHWLNKGTLNVPFLSLFFNKGKNKEDINSTAISFKGGEFSNEGTIILKGSLIELFKKSYPTKESLNGKTEVPLFILKGELGQGTFTNSGSIEIDYPQYFKEIIKTLSQDNVFLNLTTTLAGGTFDQKGSFISKNPYALNEWKFNTFTFFEKSKTDLDAKTSLHATDKIKIDKEAVLNILSLEGIAVNEFYHEGDLTVQEGMSLMGRNLILDGSIVSTSLVFPAIWQFNKLYVGGNASITVNNLLALTANKLLGLTAELVDVYDGSKLKAKRFTLEGNQRFVSEGHVIVDEQCHLESEEFEQNGIFEFLGTGNKAKWDIERIGLGSNSQTSFSNGRLTVNTDLFFLGNGAQLKVKSLHLKKKCQTGYYSTFWNFGYVEILEDSLIEYKELKQDGTLLACSSTHQHDWSIDDVVLREESLTTLKGPLKGKFSSLFAKKGSQGTFGDIGFNTSSLTNRGEFIFNGKASLKGGDLENYGRVSFNATDTIPELMINKIILRPESTVAFAGDFISEGREFTLDPGAKLGARSMKAKVPQGRFTNKGDITLFRGSELSGKEFIQNGSFTSSSDAARHCWDFDQLTLAEKSIFNLPSTFIFTGKGFKTEKGSRTTFQNLTLTMPFEEGTFQHEGQLTVSKKTTFTGKTYHQKGEFNTLDKNQAHTWQWNQVKLDPQASAKVTGTLALRLNGFEIERDAVFDVDTLLLDRLMTPIMMLNKGKILINQKSQIRNAHKFFQEGELWAPENSTHDWEVWGLRNGLVNEENAHHERGIKLGSLTLISTYLTNKSPFTTLGKTKITSYRVTNAQVISFGKDSSLESAILDNTKGNIEGVGTLAIESSNIKNEDGLIKSKDGLNIKTSSLLDNTKGQIVTEGKLLIDSPSLKNDDKGLIKGKEIELKVPKSLSNKKGKITTKTNGYGTLSLSTDDLNNEGGVMEASKGATITILKSLQNKGGTIGGDGLTTVNLNTQGKLEQAGTLLGNEVVIEDQSKEKTFTLKNGGLVGKKSVIIKAHSFTGENVEVKTPLLRLEVEDLPFKLNNQTNVERTVLAVKNGYNSYSFKDPYNTKGSFEFMATWNSEERAKKNLPEIEKLSKKEYAHARKKIGIEASINAQKGIKIYFPWADITFKNAKAGLFAEGGLIDILSAKFDLEEGTIAAQDLNVYGPLGIDFGRLVRDPSQDAFVTFYRHAKVDGSRNLGGDIVPHTYIIRDKNYTQVYDGRHLLIMPWLIPNETFLKVKNKTNLKGPLGHKAILKTGEFLLESDKPSLCYGGSLIQVEKNATLKGGPLSLECEEGHLNFTYYTYGNGNRYPNSAKHDTINSDASELYVKGHLSAESPIKVKASKLYAHTKDVNSVIQSIDLKTDSFQKNYHGDFRKEITTYTCVLKGPQYNARNSFAGNGAIPYAKGFLFKTNYFEGAQQNFPAETSYGSAVYLPTDRAEGRMAAPMVIVKIGNQNTVIGSQLDIPEKKPPVQPLLAPVRANEVKINAQQDRQQAQQGANQGQPPSFSFKMTERYFYDEKGAQDFYGDIKDQVYVIDGTRFVKATPPALMMYSPGLLLDIVRQNVSNTLYRGYLYPNTPFDQNMLKKLHQNTARYVQALPPEHREADPQALMVLGAKNPQKASLIPQDVMLYYQSFLNEEHEEELLPVMAYPPQMLEAIQKEKAASIRVQHLGIITEEATKEEIEARFGTSIANQPLLEWFKANHPAYLEANDSEEEGSDEEGEEDSQEGIKEGKQEINPPKKPKAEENKNNKPANPPKEEEKKAEKSALVQKMERVLALATGMGYVKKPSVILRGNVETENMVVLSSGDICTSAQIEAQNLVLASLFGDVVLKSLLERQYKPGGFVDQVKQQVRLQVHQVLQVYGRDVVTQGLEVETGVGQVILAMRNIMDIPLRLVNHETSQIDDDYYSMTEIKEKASTFDAKGFSLMHANGKVLLKGTEVHSTGRPVISGDQGVDWQALHEEYHTTHTSKKDGGLFGKSKTVSESSSATRAVGGSIRGDDGALILSRYGDVNLESTTLGAKTLIATPKGKVNLLQGRNEVHTSRLTNSQGALWSKAVSEQGHHVTYTPGQVEGPLKIIAQGTTIQQVRGKALEWLEKLKDKAKIIKDKVKDKAAKAKGKDKGKDRDKDKVKDKAIKAPAPQPAVKKVTQPQPTQPLGMEEGNGSGPQPAPQPIVPPHQGLQEGLTPGGLTPGGLTAQMASSVTLPVPFAELEWVMDHPFFTTPTLTDTDILDLGENVTTQWLTEIHEEKRKVLFQGPSRTLGMVVGLAISLATAGTGTQLGVSVANGMGLASHTVAHGVVSHMTMAAFSSLCVQGGTALIQEQGNIGKAAQSLTKAPFLKSLTRNVITAGLTQGIAGGLEIELKSLNLSKGSLNTQFIGHLKANLVKGIAKGTVDVAMGDSFEDVLARTLKEVPLKTVQEVAVNQIGLAYGEGEINPLIHKFLHGIVGAATGAVRGKDPTQGAIDGACAAIMAETMAEVFMPDLAETLTTYQEQGMTKEEALTQLQMDLDERTNWITLANVGIMGALGRDVNVVQEVSETALKNNFFPLVLGAASVLWELYALTHEAEIKETENQIIAYVAQKTGFSEAKVRQVYEGACFALTTGNLVRGGIKATVKASAKVGANALKKSLKEEVKAKPKGEVKAEVPEWHKILNDNPSEFKSLSGKLNDKPIQWTASKGSKQTYKVYQRNDIDWNMVRTDGPVDFIGKTNREAARAGKPPQLQNGEFVHVHHIGQKSVGPLAEVTTKIHNPANPQTFKPLHNQFKGKGNPDFPVDRSKWNMDREAYWKERVKNQ